MVDFSAKYSGKTFRWSSVELQAKLEGLSRAEKKKVWVGRDLSVSSSSRFGRICWAVAKRFRFLREFFYRVNLESTANLLWQLKDQVEEVGDRRLTAIYERAVGKFDSIAPRYSIDLEEDTPSFLQYQNLFNRYFFGEIEPGRFARVGLTTHDLELCRKFVDGELRGLRRADRSELRNLLGSRWLTDIILYFYFYTLVQKSPNTIFMTLPANGIRLEAEDPQLIFLNHEGEAVDVFAADQVLGYVSVGAQHWTLMRIDHRTKRVEYYDSAKWDDEDELLPDVLNFLAIEAVKKGEEFDYSEWDIKMMNNIPHQNNGNDCGVFVCATAEMLSQGGRLSYSQRDMPAYRAKILADLIRSHLEI